MIRFIIKRILILIPVVICVAIVIFTIMYFTPGDPVTLTLGDQYTAEMYEAKAIEMGLDKPFLEQLLDFLKSFFLEFDLGTSWVTKTSIMDELLARFPRTFIIAAISCVLQVIVAIPLGVTAAVHQNKFIDRFCSVVAMIAISLPAFWVALMLCLIFSVKLKWLPVAGIQGWYSYILPCVANALMGIGGMMRLTRSQMLEVIRADYVVTARAKGASQKRILYLHAFPNALIPLVTYIGTHFGMALGGTVVIETVFSIPGIGFYMMKAISNRDYPVVRGGVTLLAILFCLVILIIDIIYAFIDPRIKAQYERGNSKRKAKVAKQRG